MLSGLEDEESQTMLHDVTDNKGIPIGHKIIVIPVFDIYSKEEGDRTESNRITIFVCKIRFMPNNSAMLKFIM